MNERELGDLSSAPMSAAAVPMDPFFRRDPMRVPTLRAGAVSVHARVQKGDVVFAEISAAFWDYAGQVLRSFAVGEEPTPLYRDLHAAADAAFDAIAAILKAGATPAQYRRRRA